MTSRKRDRVPGARRQQAELVDVGCESLMKIAALDRFGKGPIKLLVHLRVTRSNHKVRVRSRLLETLDDHSRSRCSRPGGFKRSEPQRAKRWIQHKIQTCLNVLTAAVTRWCPRLHRPNVARSSEGETAPRRRAERPHETQASDPLIFINEHSGMKDKTQPCKVRTSKHLARSVS